MKQISILILWVVMDSYFSILGSLYLRPELELCHKNNAGYESWYFGPHFSVLYGYDFGFGYKSFSVFLYGGAGAGYNFLLSSIETGGSSRNGWVGNYIFGAKLLFYGFGAYAEYRKSFLGGSNRLSVGLTFAIGGSSYVYAPYIPPTSYIPPAPYIIPPVPYIPPEPKPEPAPEPRPEPPPAPRPAPPSTNNNNRDRDYFSYFSDRTKISKYQYEDGL
jgi:hypothetical protein